MKNGMKKKQELPQVEPVKIKPLFGLKPGVWLTIAYLLALLVILFLVGILPDIIHGSKRVTFTSDTYNAAVYVDGIYEGGTPFTRKIESGTHNVVYKVNGYEIDSFTIKVGHPVFFNWLFPRTQKVESHASLTQEAFDAISKELLEDASLYSAILEYDDTHRYANIFTTYAQSIKGSPFETNLSALKAAFLFITTSEMYEDAKNAIDILGLSLELDASKIFSTGTATANAETTLGTTLENPTLEGTPTTLKTSSFEIAGFEIPSATFSNGKSVESQYPQVKEAGKIVTTERFSISSICITENMWAHFVAKNPKWAISNKEALISEGLVDEYYLDGVTLSTVISSNRPVRNISWYAANAFCTWLSTETGKNVTLPTENQWICATLTLKEGGYQKSLMPTVESDEPSAMLGGLWELTSTPYVPLARIANYNATSIIEEYNAQTHIIVKGGSYVNSASSVDAYTVGTAYKSLCSDYMGFRIVWN